MKNELTRYDPVRYVPERIRMEPRQNGDFVALDEIEPLLEAKVAEIAELRKVIEALLPFAENATDCGPYDEGWQSAELIKTIADAQTAMAQAAQPSDN